MSVRKPTIGFLDRHTLPDDLSWPELTFPHQWENWPSTAPDQVAERLRELDIAIVNKVILDREALTQAPRLGHIQVAATGVDNVDLDACRDLGIRVSNVRGYARNAVADWAVAQLLSLLWHSPTYLADQWRGGWQESPVFTRRIAPIREVQGLHVGIRGRGDIGRGIGQRLAPFGCQVSYLERPGKTPARAGYLPFDSSLRNLDVLILACPVTPETRQLINRERLSALKAGALLLNPARGGLVDETAVYEAILSGSLGGYAADVLSQEPMQADNPLSALCDHERVILTPHVAWSGELALRNLTQGVIAAINRVQAHDYAVCID